jgi:hypothetical protein
LRYLPPFSVVKRMVRRPNPGEKTRVYTCLEDLQAVIRTLLTVVEVDEVFYLERNADVAKGIEEGVIRSAQDHFVNHGYFEGRMPYPIWIDEPWYLTTHADFAKTVAEGTYATAQDHFDGPGYAEGRAPYPPEG